MFKIIFPILVLIGAVFFAKFLIATGPEAKKRPFVQRLPVVEVQSLNPDQYTVYLETSGVVTAATQTNLIAELPGRITNISDNFKEGSYFNKDETLLEIDKSDYLSAIDIAKSDVAVNDANLKQLIAEEKSNLNAVKLAKKNLAIGNKELARVRALFKRRTLSRSAVDTEEQRVNQLQQSVQNLQGNQSSYASRKTAIKARISSSKANLKQQSLRLSRTSIKAPYAGRVLKKNVDIGQFVNSGSLLAETYATDFVNVELPLSLNQYELLGMPEAFRNKKILASEFPTVVLTNPDSIRKDNWDGKVVRTGAELDAESRQINVIVQVDKPYEAREGISSPIRIGQYLKARIKGRTFNNVYVLPPVSVIYNREIRLLSDGKIKVVPVEVVWNSTEATVIRSDENIQGEQLILTNLTQAVNGMSVLTIDQQRKKDIEQSKSRKKREVQRIEKKDKEQKKEQLRKKSAVIPDYIAREESDPSQKPATKQDENNSGIKDNKNKNEKAVK